MKRFTLAILLSALMVSFSYGIAYDLRSSGEKAATTTKMPGQIGVWTKTIDFAEDGLTSSDYAKLVTIPAGTTVLGVSMYVDTAETATTTLEVGDSTDIDGYLDAVSIGTADVMFNSFHQGTSGFVAGVLNFFDEDAAASQSAAEWGTQAGADAGGALKRIVMPWGGSIVGVSLYTATAHTTGTLTVTPTIGGTATTLTASCLAGVATGYAAEAIGVDAFAAGDAIGLKATTGSTFAATSTDWRISVFYVSDTGSKPAQAYSIGKYYAAANYLRIAPAGTCDNGKVTISMVYYKPDK